MWRMEWWSMHKELQQKRNYNIPLQFDAVVHVQTNTITLWTLPKSAENIQLRTCINIPYQDGKVNYTTNNEMPKIMVASYLAGT